MVTSYACFIVLGQNISQKRTLVVRGYNSTYTRMKERRSAKEDRNFSRTHNWASRIIVRNVSYIFSM